MLRFEPDGTAMLVAQSDTPWDPPPLGTRFTLEGENVVTAVFRTGEAARLDDWAKATGPVAEMARVLGIRSSVATPIVVEGRLWGTLVAVTSQSEPLPRETDSRIGEFTELVATAIANAGAREELSRLVEEQAALRRSRDARRRGSGAERGLRRCRVEVGQLLEQPELVLARRERARNLGARDSRPDTRASRHADASAARRRQRECPHPAHGTLRATQFRGGWKRQRRRRAPSRQCQRHGRGADLRRRRALGHDRRKLERG